MIKAVIFDLSEVLLKGLLKTEDIISERYGFKVTNDQWQIKEIDDLFHGKITEHEYWKAVIDHYNWSISVDDLSTAIRENFSEIRGTRKVIIGLKRKGYKLGLLSVHAKEWIDFCEKKYGFHTLFDSISYSFEIAVSKPSREAYEAILDELRIAPDECIFVDDSATNVKAAAEMGIHAIRFRDSEQLTQALKEMGVEA